MIAEYLMLVQRRRWKGALAGAPIAPAHARLYFALKTRRVRMKQFKDRVAVITGGGSGLGRAMAMRFAGEGMQIVLADTDEKALAGTEADLKHLGAKVLVVKTDVSKADQMETLARKTLDAFGGVHLV